MFIPVSDELQLFAQEIKNKLFIQNIFDVRDNIFRFI